MNFTKKVNALILGLATVLAAGCGDEKIEDPIPGNQKACVLAKVNVMISGNTGLPSVFEEAVFDNQGRLIGTKRQPQGDSQRFIYNAAGKIVRADYYDKAGVLWSYNLYKYNASGSVSRIMQVEAPPTTTILDSGRVIDYNYDANNNLTNVSRQAGATIDSVFYLPNNALKIKRYTTSLSSGKLELAAVEEYQCDNKKNAFGNFRHLYLMNESLAHFFPIAHNITTAKYTNHLENVTASKNFTYQYNADQYPVSWVETNNSGFVSEGTYEYNCQ